MGNILDLKKQPLAVKDEYVFKIKGEGNKHFNAYAVKYFISKDQTTKGKIVEVPNVVICFRNKLGLEKISSVFTKVIHDNWKSNSPNAQYTRAITLVNFLNWILLKKNIYTKLNSWSDLTLEIATDYLNSLSYETSRQRHTYVKCTIRQFYKTLAEESMLNNILLSSFSKDPFASIRTPGKRFKNTKHSMPLILIKILIQISEKETPDITFGVILGICSGARCGELVNLSRDSIIPMSNDELMLYIEDRYFRKDISSPRARGEVKKPRTQRVYSNVATECFGSNIIQKEFEKHLNKYKTTDDTNALFADNNGKAMTASTFSRRFRKLKSKFISFLESSEDDIVFSYANTLKTRKWLTHIMRGVFSNVTAEQTNSLIKVKIARGDDSDNASLDYITDTDEITKLLETALQGSRVDIFKTPPPLPITEFKPNK